METTGFEIDWTFEATQNEIETVWYVVTEDGKMLVASNSDFDALIIADTEEEAIEQGKEYIKKLFISDMPETLVAKQTSLFALSTRWRWFVYRQKARFLCMGKNWVPQTLSEYPGIQSKIAPDPMAMVFYGRGFDGIVKNNGVPIVAGDIIELTNELMDIGSDPNKITEFSVQPMFAFATTHAEVWYRGRKHNLIETMMRNPRLLVKNGMLNKDVLAKLEDGENNER